MYINHGDPILPVRFSISHRGRLKTTKDYGSRSKASGRSSCRSYYRGHYLAQVSGRGEGEIVPRTTEIHVVGSRRTFVRLSRVKLDSRRHCVRSPARIASTRTTVPFFSSSLAPSLHPAPSLPYTLSASPLRRPLCHRAPLPLVLWLPSPSARLLSLPSSYSIEEPLPSPFRPRNVSLALSLSPSFSLSVVLSFPFSFSSFFTRRGSRGTRPNRRLLSFSGWETTVLRYFRAGATTSLNTMAKCEHSWPPYRRRGEGGGGRSFRLSLSLFLRLDSSDLSDFICIDTREIV